MPFYNFVSFSVQVAFYEILNGLWVRNGLQIKGQAMTYIQCNFCNSMVDADLYLLQVCSMMLPSQLFLLTVLKRYDESIKSLERFSKVLMSTNVGISRLACLSNRTSVIVLTNVFETVT